MDTANAMYELSGGADGATETGAIDLDALRAYAKRVGPREARRNLHLSAESLLLLLWGNEEPNARTCAAWRRINGEAAPAPGTSDRDRERRMALREWWARYTISRGIDRPKQNEGAEILGIGIGYFRLMLCGASPVSVAVAESVEELLDAARQRNREVWECLLDAGLPTSSWPDTARAAWILDEIVERWREYLGAPDAEEVEKWVGLLAAVSTGSAHRMYKGVAQLAGTSLPSLIAAADDMRRDDRNRAARAAARKAQEQHNVPTPPASEAPAANAWAERTRDWLDANAGDREHLELDEVADAVGSASDAGRSHAFVAIALRRAGWLPQRPNRDHPGPWFTRPV